MVRINLIEPKALSDQHLIAEYREILLLMGYVKKHPRVTSTQKEYTLYNPLTFFKDKLAYLLARFILLKDEMKLRGFKPTKDFMGDFDLVDIIKENYLWNEYKPSPQEVSLVKQRIAKRLTEKPYWYRYYSKKVPSSELITRVMNAKTSP